MSKIKFALFFIISIFIYSAFASTNPSHTKKDKFISYTEKGQGTPLILIHAFPTDQRLWAPQQETLQSYFRVITLDLWGFGQSSTVDGNAVTMDDYADELKQLLDQLHIQKAIIGGESMGGYIALAFLEKYPNRIQGLILSDTQSIADSPETKEKRETSAVQVLKEGTSQLIQNFLPKALSSEATDETQKFLQTILEVQTPTAVASALRGMALRHDTSHILENTALPILIITGEQDALISPEQSKNMQTLAKNSKLVVISHAGHLSNLEKPKEWNQAVIDQFHP